MEFGCCDFHESFPLHVFRHAFTVVRIEVGVCVGGTVFDVVVGVSTSVAAIGRRKRALEDRRKIKLFGSRLVLLHGSSFHLREGNVLVLL